MIESIINLFFQVYMFMLLIRIFGSWFPEFQTTRFMQFISFCTDPYLNVFRQIIPPLGAFDISPIFAFLSLGLIEALIKYIAHIIFK